MQRINSRYHLGIWYFTASKPFYVIRGDCVIVLHIILPMLEWRLRYHFAKFFCTRVIKICWNMLKLNEVNLNLWQIILKVALTIIELPEAIDNFLVKVSLPQAVCQHLSTQRAYLIYTYLIIYMHTCLWTTFLVLW